VGDLNSAQRLQKYGAEFRVQGSGFRVQGSGFGVQGAGFRVCMIKAGFDRLVAPPRKRVQNNACRVQGPQTENPTP